MGAVQSTASKPKRVQHSTFCDIFSNVILTGKVSVKIECYMYMYILTDPSAELSNNAVIKVNQNIN